MKIFRMVLTAAAVAGLCVLWSAAPGITASGDPWEDQEYTAWSKKDAEKVLSNSPWARRVATKTDMVKESEDYKAQGGAPKSGTEAVDRGTMREGDFATVVWWSAKSPRRAYVRQLQHAGQNLAPETIQQFLDQPLAHHVLTLRVEGGDLVKTSAKLTPEDLKQGAWLETSRLKKIAADEAAVVNGADGKPDRLRFHFPKEMNGAPTVTSEDKRVLFRFKLPRRQGENLKNAEQFEVSFEVKKMAARSEADF